MRSQISIERALTIGGWMSPRELIWLAAAAQTCYRILEFGSFHGRSTRALADNSPPNCIIHCVDPWNGDYLTDDELKVADMNTYVKPYFEINLKDHIESGKVVPHRGYSYSFKSDEKFDLVFLDGDHRYQTVIKDINKAWELTRSHGIICGHDYGHTLWPGVKKAVDERFLKINLMETIWFKERE
jgi:predicted O-methyltransferase YrrM